MTMAEVRTAAELVRLHDQAVEWRQSFEGDKSARKHPYIEFADIGSRAEADGQGEGCAWDGRLVVPRPVAIEMMRLLERHALAELEKMGVTA